MKQAGHSHRWKFIQFIGTGNRIFDYSPNTKWNHENVHKLLKNLVSRALTSEEEGHAIHHYQIIQFIELL